MLLNSKIYSTKKNGKFLCYTSMRQPLAKRIGIDVSARYYFEHTLIFIKLYNQNFQNNFFVQFASHRDFSFVLNFLQ